MLVQRVLMPASPVESWTLLGDDAEPVEPVERYLAYLTDIERSPNTVKAYAHDLKDWFAFLSAHGLDWRDVRLEDVGRFVAWLRLPPAARSGLVAVLPSVVHHCTESTVNRKLSAVSAFYQHAARQGIDFGDLLTTWQPAGRRGVGWKPFLHHISKSAGQRRIPLTAAGGRERAYPASDRGESATTRPTGSGTGHATRAQDRARSDTGGPMNISDEQNRLLIASRHALDQARQDPATWQNLAYTARHADDGRVFDGNKAARFAVLWAAQYDHRPHDVPLLRFLLAQEITFYREATPWGLAPDLTLAGFLVAEHRHVQDVWLHWQAKNINFDTAMGYHIYHLLTPGLAATADAVRSSSHPERDRVLAEITAGHHTDTAVEEWLGRQRLLFPSDPAEENLKTWAHRAARLGERTASRHFMIEWAQGQRRTDRTLNTLQFHLARLGYLPEAIAAQKQAIAISGASWAGAKASKLLTLVRLERRADNFPGAWQALHECEQAMPPDKDGMGQGLWRHFLREYLLLVPFAPDPAASRRLLEAADQHLHGVPRLWMDKVLDALIAAAEHVGDTRMIHRFQELAQAAEHDRADGSTTQADPQQSGEPGISS